MENVVKYNEIYIAIYCNTFRIQNKLLQYIQVTIKYILQYIINKYILPSPGYGSVRCGFRNGVVEK
jgi:hypothetical protein